MKKERTVLILALCALILISVCAKPQAKPPAADDLPAADVLDEQPPAEVQETEPPAETEEIYEFDDAPVIESEGEAAYCIFPSVEALTDAVRAEQEAFWKDAVAYGNGLADVSAVYVPAQDYEGFRLFQVAVNPYYIFQYYIPLDSASDMVFDPEDIVITQSRSREMTLESVCAPHGISPDGDGYAYSAKHGDLFFERDGTVIFISAPEGMDDYDSLRALCELERVDIERYDSGIWDWDFETYGDDAPQIAMLGEENYRAYEQATSELGLSSWDAANQFCSDLTELGDLAGWTAAERVKGDGGEYYLRVARLL